MTTQPQATQQSGKTNGLAIAGFVCSLLYFSGIIGLILSAVALNQIGKNPGQGGKGLAVAGLVIGIVDCVWLLFLLGLLGAAAGSSGTQLMGLNLGM